MKKYLFAATVGLSFMLLFYTGCKSSDNGVIEIGFLDVVEDATLSLARDGFVEALSNRGYSESKGNIRIIFRNAQGDVTTLIQSVQYFQTKNVNLIATNATLSTVSTVQRVKNIPVCMMVSPEPSLAGLTDADGHSPSNLFGVYETLAYIDTSISIIKEGLPSAKRVGIVYNQAETQSLLALERIREQSKLLGFEILAMPVTNSSEIQLVVKSILNKGIDAFFAMPDNIIFSSFEVILKQCNESNVPIFTSEAGLVARGAVAAFGADFYGWGYQAGECAATYLDDPDKEIPPLEIVKLRRKVANEDAMKRFGLVLLSDFEPIN